MCITNTLAVSGHTPAVCPAQVSELVHFRNRIGEEGIELILKESIRVNSDNAGRS